eukprot:7422705-Heterocapsa_arctica.AAC.1
MPGLEHYLPTIDTLWLRCVELPTNDSMTVYFYDQVKLYSCIRRDIEDYDRMDDDDANRSYQWLRRACNRALDLWRTDGHRKSYLGALN